MPRIVDHDQRRAEIAESALRVIVRVGLDGVTLRGIAVEAGWSTGALRHYFSNQRELQEYVIQAATETLRNQVVRRVQQPRMADLVVARVASIVEELLPLDAERREEYALWVAVTEWERRNPPPDGSRTWRDQRGLYRQCIALLRGHTSTSDPEQAGHLHPDPEVEEWAALLHTFVDGLAAQLVNTPGEIPVETARRLLTSFLHAVPRA